MMHKESKARFHKHLFSEPPAPTIETGSRLNNIIKTFRQNHRKLIQKIQECDKRREYQHEFSKKKTNQKVLNDKFQFPPRHTETQLPQPPRPYSQLKSDRTERPVKENFINARATAKSTPFQFYDEKLCARMGHYKDSKENIGQDYPQRNTTTKEDQCEDILVTPFEEQQPFKLVKINVNKLIPLSIDRLREKIKML